MSSFPEQNAALHKISCTLSCFGDEEKSIFLFAFSCKLFPDDDCIAHALGIGGMWARPRMNSIVYETNMHAFHSEVMYLLSSATCFIIR
jgi:hypothetical protein